MSIISIYSYGTIFLGYATTVFVQHLSKEEGSTNEKKTAGLKAGKYIEKLKGVTDVLEIGLFLNTCNKIIIGTTNGVKVVENEFKFK